MKQEMKNIPTNIYICEICNKEYQTVYQATGCERIHEQITKQENCKHNFVYGLEIDWEEHDLDILEYCDKCGLHKRLSIDEADFTSEELGVIYEREKQKKEEQQRKVERMLSWVPGVIFKDLDSKKEAVIIK